MISQSGHCRVVRGLLYLPPLFHTHTHTHLNDLYIYLCLFLLIYSKFKLIKLKYLRNLSNGINIYICRRSLSPLYSLFYLSLSLSLSINHPLSICSSLVISESNENFFFFCVIFLKYFLIKYINNFGLL